MKSEPGEFSIDDLAARPSKTEPWDGVRNYQARNFMRQMQVSDQGFFYHSLKEKSVVGIVEVISAAHPDSTTDDPRWDCVDIKAVQSVPQPVTLAQIKECKDLQNMVLVKNSRLSVQPVTPHEWRTICKMAGV